MMFLAPAYLILRDSIGGRSIGKRIAGVILVTEKDFKPLRPIIAFVRNLFLALPLLLFPISVFFLSSAPESIQKIAASAVPWAIRAGLLSAFAGRDGAFHLVALNMRKLR